MTAFRRLFAGFSLTVFTVAALADKPPYPATRTEDVVDILHGVKVADPYRWLEKADDPEVQAWTEQQNAFTRRYLDGFGEVRAALTKRLEELFAANVGSAPRVYKDRYFFVKREGLENQPRIYVRKGASDATPKLVIDPNTFSDDGTVAIDWWYPSPDGTLIAYGKSASGSEKSTLYLRDVDGGNDTTLVIPNTRACTVAWDADGAGFFYVRYPNAGEVPPGDEVYYRHVYYHKFGTEVKDDPKIFGEGRPKEEWNNVSASSDNQWVFLSNSLDWSKNDLYLRGPNDQEFRPVAVGLDGQFSGDVYGGKLFLHTNYKAPRYRIVVADPANPVESGWKDVVPEGKGVIESFAIVGGKLVLNVLENAYSRISVYEPTGEHVGDVELPALGTVSELNGAPDAPGLFFSFQSFAYPPTVFRYDLKEKKLDTIDRLDVAVDLDAFETRQVWFESKDGTKVPMFVIHKKGLSLDGSNPTILYGYGGFDQSITPTFVRTVFPWLERGGVYASVNLRGGGEFGKEWHLAGRLDKKQNVFDDMIAAAEKLIADGYTRPDRLAARGGSNGGLLMGAMMTQRPDLFRAIHCAVPLLDMIRYHNFSIARLWIPEYGSAEDPTQFRWLLAWSPYHNVKPGVKYPATLFTTADSDSRVDPMHARKMAALVQAATSSSAPILLWVESKAGHGAGKPLSKRIESDVDWLTFFMWQLGMADGSPQ